MLQCTTIKNLIWALGHVDSAVTTLQAGDNVLELGKKVSM